MKTKLILFWFLALSVFFAMGPASASEEAGLAAENAGKYREALDHYTAALGTMPAGEKEFALRKKIVELAARVKPTPQTPKEFDRFLARGEAAFETAKSPADFERAIKEFQAAADLAPWKAAAYFNLGIAQEKADRPRDAMASFKLYLLAAPGAADAAAVEKRIYKLEYAAETPDNTGRSPLGGLQGTWVLRNEGLRSAWIYDHYFSASIEGTDSVRFKYTHTVVVAAESGFGNSPIKSMTFSLRVVGNTVSGTFESEYNWIDCIMREAWPVKGVLYTDGRQIDLEYWASMPRGDGCVRSDFPPQQQRIILRKQ